MSRLHFLYCHRCLEHQFILFASATQTCTWMIQACCSIIGLNNRVCNDIKPIRRAVVTLRNLQMDRKLVSARFIPGSGHSIVLMHGNGLVATGTIIYTYFCTRQAFKCKRYVVAFCMFFFTIYKTNIRNYCKVNTICS